MKYLFCLIIMFSANTVFSAPTTRSNLTIKTWHPSSTNRHHATGYNGITRVYFDTHGAWGDTTCRQDSADIIEEDKHIISPMLAAFMAGKKVKVEVNDALPKLSNVCKVTAVFISK